MPRQTNSAKKTSLNAVEQYELNQWLEQNHINSTNLRRSFTDVLPLARLLARYYPDLIDLNYYPPRNSVQNKLCNWESFNKRVLARLGVNLTREQMVRVARSVPGSVDLLLYSIMRVQMAAERKAREAKGSTDDDDNDDNDDDDNDNNADDDDNVIKHSDNKVAATAHEQQAAAHVEPAKKTVVLSNLNNNDDDDDAKDDDDDDVDDDDDDNNAGAAAAAAGGQAMRSKPNMPKTLKLAQAALKRSERAQMEQRRGVATGILARARGNPSSPSSNSNSPNNRRLTIAGSETGRGAGGGGGGGGGGAVSATVAMDLNVAHRQRGEQQQQKQQQRTVLYSHYMQAVKQLQQKNEKIARFDQLSAHLENMLQLKCERIDELQQQVANAVNCLKPAQLKVTQNNSNNNNNNNNNSNNNNSNNNHNNSDSNNNTSRTHSPTQKRRTRLKKRLVCNTTNNSIEHKAGTIAIPGIGIAGASFPVKLSQFH